MPVPNTIITAGQSVVIDSNPKDATSSPTLPTLPIAWTFADPGSATLGTLTPQGVLSENCKFSSPSGGPLGLATINITGPQLANPTTAQVTVNVIAGQLDHFAPTFEDPTTP